MWTETAEVTPYDEPNFALDAPIDPDEPFTPLTFDSEQRERMMTNRLDHVGA